MNSDDELGRIGHEAWKSYMIGQGYADHAMTNPYTNEDLYGRGPILWYCGEPECAIDAEQHHPDMVAWVDLPENKRGKYLAMTKVGFLASYTEVERLKAKLDALDTLILSTRHENEQAISALVSENQQLRYNAQKHKNSALVVEAALAWVDYCDVKGSHSVGLVMYLHRKGLTFPEFTDPDSEYGQSINEGVRLWGELMAALNHAE